VDEKRGFTLDGAWTSSSSYTPQMWRDMSLGLPGRLVLLSPPESYLLGPQTGRIARRVAWDASDEMWQTSLHSEDVCRQITRASFKRIKSGDFDVLGGRFGS
jgi:hypothetical protein